MYYKWDLHDYKINCSNCKWKNMYVKEIYMTTNLTVETASEKNESCILQLVFQGNKQRKMEKKFYDLRLATFCGETNMPYIKIDTYM